MRNLTVTRGKIKNFSKTLAIPAYQKPYPLQLHQLYSNTPTRVQIIYYSTIYLVSATLHLAGIQGLLFKNHDLKKTKTKNTKKKKKLKSDNPTNVILSQKKQTLKCEYIIQSVALSFHL